MLIKRILKILLTILIIIISLIVIVNIPILTLSNKTGETDYSSWMSETLEDDQLIVDVAMLGAHDAFSNEISITSRLDPYETNSLMSGFVGTLLKGFIFRQSKTQMSDAEKLLRSGVRYLDIRLTYENDNWYTKHNYISGEFLPILDQINEFLSENPGEFLILDFQHINGLDYDSLEDYQTFYDMLMDSGILNYVYEDAILENLTYGELTDDGANSKVIIIAKFEASEGLILPYDISIRSEWADSDDFDHILDFLENESEAIQTEDLTDRLRVMQAVSTMQMSPSGILKSFGTWSLVNRAKKFNDYLLQYENLEGLMENLPIIMVDYSDTSYHDFNDEIMEIIMDFNQNS